MVVSAKSCRIISSLINVLSFVVGIFDLVCESSSSRNKSKVFVEFVEFIEFDSKPKHAKVVLIEEFEVDLINGLQVVPWSAPVCSFFSICSTTLLTVLTGALSFTTKFLNWQIFWNDVSKSCKTFSSSVCSIILQYLSGFSRGRINWFLDILRIFSLGKIGWITLPHCK